MSGPSAFDVLVSDLSACLDASGVDDAGKVLALGVVALLLGQEALGDDAEAMRLLRAMFGGVFVRRAGGEA